MPDANGMQPSDAPAAQPADVVQIQPTPTSWTFQVCDVDTAIGAQRFVAVTIYTQTGVHMVFLSPEEASGIAARIEQSAGQARTGLVLPPPRGIERPT